MNNLKRIGGLHHYAYRCRNAEETRSYYEDLSLIHISEPTRPY